MKKVLLTLTLLLPTVGISSDFAMSRDAFPGEPKIEILTPVRTTIAEDSITIEIAFYDVATTDVWDLFYVKDSDPVLHPIAMDLPVSAGTVVWDVGSLAKGYYNIVGMLKSAERVYLSTPSGRLVIP